jgi:hypothetical protein
LIEVQVDTLWHEQVGVNEERYVKPALLRHEGLLFIMDITGEIMEILSHQVETCIVGRSEKRFKDKYGGPDYYLVYYKWVPTAKQEILI